MSERASERTNELAQRGARTRQAERGKRMSERCDRTNKHGSLRADSPSACASRIRSRDVRAEVVIRSDS